MSKKSKADQIQPQWLAKSLAGGGLGLTLTYALLALFAWFGPGGIDAPVKVQFNMWIITPIWLLIFSFSYLFRTGLSAIVGLGAANLVLYSIFFVLRAWL